MFVGRPFILLHRLEQHGDDVSHGRGADDAPATAAHSCWDRAQPGGLRESLVQDCVSAAEEAIEMCHTLQTGELGLTRASYIEYSSCRAAVLVLIAYSIAYRTNHYSIRLQRGLDAIREMASTGDSARSEISLLETLEAALHHLHVFDVHSEQASSSAGNDIVRDDYDGFVTWYKNKISGEPNTGASHGGSEDMVSQHTHSDISQLGMVATQCEASSGDHWSGLDFQNAGNDMAFFNPDFGQDDALEKDLLDSLLWIPD